MPKQENQLLFAYSTQGSYGLWNILDSYGIGNSIFQDLESYGMEGLFKMAMKNFWILFGKILNYLKIDVIQCRINHRIYLFILLSVI